jgi:hypothetical protein
MYIRQVNVSTVLLVLGLLAFSCELSLISQTAPTRAFPYARSTNETGCKQVQCIKAPCPLICDQTAAETAQAIKKAQAKLQAFIAATTADNNLYAAPALKALPTLIAHYPLFYEMNDLLPPVSAEVEQAVINYPALMQLMEKLVVIGEKTKGLTIATKEGERRLTLQGKIYWQQLNHWTQNNTPDL